MGIQAVFSGGLQTLNERAVKMSQALKESQSITDTMVSVLGSFDHRVSALQTGLRPNQNRIDDIRKAHVNIDKALETAEVILFQFDLSREAESTILRGPNDGMENYLEAIEKIKDSISFFSNSKSFKNRVGVINHSNNVLEKAISKLEEEFKQLLSSYSKPVEPESLFDCLPSSSRPSCESEGNQGDSGGKSHSSHELNYNTGLEIVVYTPPTLIPPRILPQLHHLAQQVVQAGHQQQLVKIYRDVRSPILKKSLQKLGVEKLNMDDVQKMQWDVLEAKIGNWVQFMRIAIKLLFAGERRVCDQILEGIGSLDDQCFAEVTSSSVEVLLSFGVAITRSKRSPEKLFVLLDMYEIMQELHLEIEALFRGKYCEDIRYSATDLTKRLSRTAQETFGDFEEAIGKDAVRAPVADGTVHPLTSYVLNYVKFLFDYQSTLKQLFQDLDSQFAAVTMRIIQALQTNLETKSKQYKDPALTQLFLMNNIHYLVRSVRNSEAKDLLGDDWVQIHRRVVQQHANQYKRIAWTKILKCLSTQGMNSSGSNSSGVSKSILKDRLKSFNNQFEEIHHKQSQWTVPDLELRESLRLAVAEVLLPAYRSFIQHFGPLVEVGKNPQKYIRYTPEDIDLMLGEFFEGKPLHEPKR